jgi:hypothetical protein
MNSRHISLRHTGVACACAALLLLSVTPGPSAGEVVRPKPGRVVATYDAALAGINLGDFKVTTTIKKSGYKVAAKGSFSMFSGLVYKATAKTMSSGTFTQAAPQPATFTLEYDTGKKREERYLRFDNGAVSEVRIVPHKKKKKSRRVPLDAEQLKDVFDPLTAAFLAVRSDAPAGDLDVCRQTIPVFDGKQRFDVVLTPKRSERLGRRAPKSLSGPAAVCRVRYVPIAGHRPDHSGVQFMRKTEGIEVWFVPVPRTGLYVPYKILVPTGWGDGSITLTRLKIKPGKP